jgi:hypothetical protein
VRVEGSDSEFWRRKKNCGGNGSKGELASGDVDALGLSDQGVGPGLFLHHIFAHAAHALFTHLTLQRINLTQLLSSVSLDQCYIGRLTMARQVCSSPSNARVSTARSQNIEGKAAPWE